MEANPELVKPLLKPLLTIGNREFKEKYGYMSGSWRGKKSRFSEMQFLRWRITRMKLRFQI
ncbi:hypothetical protein GCM10020331_088750 [Ectobacillus funiculus]